MALRRWALQLRLALRRGDPAACAALRCQAGQLSEAAEDLEKVLANNEVGSGPWLRAPQL